MSNISWKYVKKLINPKDVENYLSEHGLSLDKELIKFIGENNSGRPSPNCFDTDKTKERVFMELISYNPQDKGYIDVYYPGDYGKTLFPIASDPFGNLICVNIENEKIYFINMETLDVEFICTKWKDLIDMLY